MAFLDRFRRAAPAPDRTRKIEAAAPAPRRDFGRFGPINGEVATAAHVLPSRTRFLYANNAHCRNGVDSLVGAIWGSSGAKPVGVGKRAAAQWARESRRQNLPAKIRTMLLEMIVAGEGLAVMNGAELTVLPREQLDSFSDGQNIVSGVRLDALGNPVAYRILPGLPDDARYRAPVEIPAADVLHLYR